ncbi:uncharacterized protein LOC111270811 isoform X1 [Varroa jacobsoni]|uniref:Uncharacterized protein n=1 Tax=Varroa destructor TaxID=109461 RepID=A0A7M7JID6_VARDE|nr:uncharacterized protein LOC111244212 isoform X1 [Varroa destructor]XP_022706964.1 uncharacterized protein LOC111270811 isoform X1 [Varroa jacobsoni]
MCSTSCNPPYLLYAFDEALTAFEAYLDSLAETSSPDKSAGTSQVCVGRFGCLLVDYLNLIEACVTNHPDLSDQQGIPRANSATVSSTSHLRRTTTSPWYSYIAASTSFSPAIKHVVVKRTFTKQRLR